MAKQRDHDSVLGKPIPSARIPWFVILCLIAALILVYMGFLRSPAKLLGPPIPRNEYLQAPQATPPPAVPTPPPNHPAGSGQ